MAKLKKQHPRTRTAEQRKLLATGVLDYRDGLPNFIDEVLLGHATADEIDDHVQLWHQGQTPAWGQLWDWLGMSLDEYSVWIEEPGYLHQLIEDRRKVRDRYGFVQLCANCRQRPAQAPWGDLIRGGTQRWCSDCVVSTQLEYAREQAAKIPELEKRLTEIKATE